MSGLVKAKKYDWKDSNLALFGSDTEKQVKKESAECEEAWSGCGQEVGLQIWRIVKFEVKHWPKEDYGSFYEGDSYIILNTYKEGDSDELLYDVHFWIGKYSTQDEYGTAAYKTVELDTLLDDKAVQHREVSGHESELFQSYFPAIEIMKGGADTGFRRVQPEEYTPRLLKVSGTRKTVTISEVARCRSLVTSDDVFVLDAGLEIFQFNGSNCNKDEKFKAVEYVQSIKSTRGKAQSETLDEEDTPTSHKFYSFLDQEEDEDDNADETDGSAEKKLFKVSDASGEIAITDAEGVGSVDELDPNEVYVLDNGQAAFVWVGGGASENEKKNGYSYAHKILQDTNHVFVPITIIKQGQPCADLDTALAA